jgi:hypothetical protein
VGAPRLVPLALLAANLLLTFGVLREVAGGRWALAGTVLLALSPLFLLTGATLLSHSSAFFCLAAATYAALRAVRGKIFLWAAVCGLGIGLLVLTRPWTGVSLGMFPGVLLLWAVRRRRKWGALVPAALAAGACAGFFLLYNQGVSGSPWVTGYQAIRGADRVEFGFGTVEPGIHEHTPGQGLKNALLLGLRFLFWSWGWPLALLPAGLVLAGLKHLAPSSNREPGIPPRGIALGALGMVGVGFLSYVPYWALGVNDTGPVKTYELLLPFCVLTVLGAREWAHRHGERPVAAYGLASLVCALVVFWPPHVDHLRRVSARVEEPLRMVEEAVQKPALVFVTGMQRQPAGSWVYSTPNPRPDLSDPILFVRDHGRRDRLFRERHPERHPYRLVHDRAGFRVVSLRRVER